MSSKDIYCVYLTTYLGNKLPPFYIGSTSIKNVENGYRGSVRSKSYRSIWEQELKENPHLFKIKIIKKFENHIDAIAQELKFQTHQKVATNQLFINKAYAKANFNGPGVEPWNKGLTKETNETVLNCANNLRGRKAADFEYLKIISKKVRKAHKGRTKEEFQYLQERSDFLKSEHPNVLQIRLKISNTQTGRTADEYEHLRRAAKTRERIPEEFIEQLISMRNEGLMFKDIWKWLEINNIIVSLSCVKQTFYRKVKKRNK